MLLLNHAILWRTSHLSQEDVVMRSIAPDGFRDEDRFLGEPLPTDDTDPDALVTGTCSERLPQLGQADQEDPRRGGQLHRLCREPRLRPVHAGGDDARRRWHGPLLHRQG